ncbi:MAG: hypothetical protein M3N46_02785, partial [Actinomycetota bacterium]|nr:hypothetical protein [Actinomycetota bacterium]
LTRDHPIRLEVEAGDERLIGHGGKLLPSSERTVPGVGHILPRAVSPRQKAGRDIRLSRPVPADALDAVGERVLNQIKDAIAGCRQVPRDSLQIAAPLLDLDGVEAAGNESQTPC